MILSVHLLFHHLNNGSESFGVVHGQVGENLAVQPHVGFVHLAHKYRVRHTVEAATGVDTLDPQRAELSFLAFSVTICVLLAFFPFVFGYCPNVFTSAPISFGAVEDFFSACP